MKKFLPYLLGVLLLAVLGFMIFRKKNPAPKKVSTLITLSKNDKSPYGAYVFYNSLQKFFPKAKIFKGDKTIYENTNLGLEDTGRLYVVLTPYLEFSEYELEELMDFAGEGNTVFVSAFDIGYEFEQLLDVKARSDYAGIYPLGNIGPFGMKHTLEVPAFKSKQSFSYPGQLMEGYFDETNETFARALGRGNNGKINFIHLKKGKGNVFVHMSPMAFSNYFLLYDNNQRYLEQIFSLVPNLKNTTRTIIWHAYVNNNSGRGSRREQKPNWFSSIMKEPSFRAGILLALLLLLLYTISEMRRRQRIIPVIKPPVNDSLEFVKTMGLLYYQRKDHQNLAQKMSAYFMEHVRSRYKIFAKELDANFIKEVSYKSGANEQLVTSIISDIKRVNNNVAISDTGLITLQKNIEAFYEMSS